jgi:hypothetical protein
MILQRNPGGGKGIYNINSSSYKEVQKKAGDQQFPVTERHERKREIYTGLIG